MYNFYKVYPIVLNNRNNSIDTRWALSQQSKGYSKIRVLGMHVTPLPCLRASAMVYTGALLYWTKSAGF